MRYQKFLAVAALCGLFSCDQGSGGAGSKAKPAATADAAIQQAISGVAAKDPGVLWASLPASYQKDVHEIVHGFYGKVDAETYDRVCATVRKVLAVLRDKRDNLLAHPMLKGMSRGKVKDGELGNAIDGVVELLSTVFNSELGSVAKMRKVDLGSLLDGTGRKVLRQLANIAAKAEKDPFAKLSAAKVELVDADGDTARVRVEIPGEKNEVVEMRRVEGKWIPGGMAKRWEKGLQRARKQLAAMPSSGDAETKAQVAAFCDQVDKAVAQLTATKNQAQFNGVLGQLMQGLMSGGMGAAPGSRR